VAGFDAFISYSRRASTTLAINLQGAVERFAKPWYALRAIRVFRDDASMSANPALWSTIERGLIDAEWFLLLASPPAAQSEYVAREVTWWREHKSSDRILIVLEEGVDIAWDREANDFDFEATDSLPRALSGAYAEEPRWIDLRWFEPDGGLGVRDPRWLERVADISAAVRGVERDELIGENVRQHRRAQRLVRLGISLLSLLLVASLVATFVAVGQRSEANRQRDAANREATIALARQLSAQAVTLAPTDLQTASLLAVQAYRTHADAQTLAALFKIATASPHLVRPMKVGALVTASAVTPSGLVVTGDEAGKVQLWDVGRPTVVAQLSATVTSVAVSDDGRTVAAADTTQAVLWSGGDTVPVSGVAPWFVALDAAGTRLAVSDNAKRTGVWAVAAGGPQLLGVARAYGSGLAFGPAGLSVYGQASAMWFLVDPDTAAVTGRGRHTVGQGNKTAVSADGATFAGYNGGADVDVWRDEAAFAADAVPNAVAHTTFASGLALALSADGSLVAGQTDGRVEVAAVQALQAAPQQPEVLDGAGPMDSGNGGAIAFGGDRYLVSASDTTAMLWDLTQFNRFGRSWPVPVPSGCTACGATHAALSPDGSRLALWALGDGDTGPVLVDLGTGASTLLDPTLEHGYDALAWSGDDRLLGFASATSTLMSIELPDATATPVATVHLAGDFDAVVDLAATRSRAELVARSGQIYRVDLDTGTVTESDLLLGAPHIDSAYVWEFAPDASQLAVLIADPSGSGGSDGLVVADLDKDELTYQGPAVAFAWDAGSRLHVFDGTSASVLRDGALTDKHPATGVDPYPPPVLSPDAAILVTGGNLSDIRLLDLTRQAAVFGTVPVPQHENAIPAVAITPDGAALVVAVPEVVTPEVPPSVDVLSLDPRDWITAACAVATRDLTKDDWARYGVGPAPDDLRCER